LRSVVAPMIIVPGNNTVRRIGSHAAMLLGLAAGLALGLAAVSTQSPQLLAISQWLRPLGTVFSNLLSMVAIPLVVTAVFGGIAGLGDLRRVGRLGARTFAYFGATSLAAIVIGFLLAGAMLPLAAVTPAQQAALRDAARSDPSFVRHAAQQLPAGTRFIVDLIPSNPIAAAVEGNLLPLIVFTTIFAIATAALPDEKRQVLTELADATTQALIRIVHWVLLLAPFGIFALVAGAVAQFGPDLIVAMMRFIGAVIVGLALFIVLIYVPAVKLVARLRVGRYFRAIRASLLMAFSTTSSLATLPVMLEAAETDLRISRTVAGFVLPLGASIGRAGSALFQAVAVVFIARLYGVDLNASDMFGAGASVFLTSLSVASVPSASIVSLAPAFTATGLPFTGLQLLLGLDRIPDMFRTMTNVLGTLTGAAVVAAVEGEKLDPL
jgi:proton glutamate symport protein